MKFKYLPNITIVDYDRLVNICTFDESGFFETDNERIINYLTRKALGVKVVDEPEKTPVKEEPKKAPADGLYNCKKCDFATPNQGELMVHYRKVHPKK